MTLEQLFSQAQALPSIPKVVQELIQSLGKDDVLTGDIARQLAADQVLSAKALRLANSAYYNVPRTIGTVDEALKMLGFLTVRTLVMSSGIAASFKPTPGFDLKAFWRFSLHTAVAAKFLAKKAQLDPEQAFTIGLLHGIGRLVMESGAGAEMAALPRVSALPSPERAAVERQAFGYSFAEVGAELARRWNFPEAFVTAIEGSATPDAEASPLACLIHVAAWLARADDATNSNAERMQALMTSPAEFGKAAARIGLTANDVLAAPPLAELSAGLEAMIQA